MSTDRSEDDEAPESSAETAPAPRGSGLRDAVWIPLIGALTLALVVLANLAIPRGAAVPPPAVAAGAAAPAEFQHVLFIGNSQTYVGNLPAVFVALARASGRPLDAAMLARGGETLTEHLADPRLARALASRRFDLVVAQERGGDLNGGFGPEAEPAARSAAVRIAADCRRAGARPLLLGTWQPLAESSRHLDQVESELARSLHEPHAAVSEPLQRALAQHPAPDWYAADGMHPGRLLVLLQAVSVYHAVFDAWPAAADFHVDAFIYGVKTRFSTDTPTSEPLAGQEFENGIDYRAGEVSWMIEAISRPSME